MTLGVGVDVGYYAQEHEKLDPNATVLDEARGSSNKSDGYLRSALGQFLFQDDRVFEQVRISQVARRAGWRSAS